MSGQDSVRASRGNVNQGGHGDYEAETMAEYSALRAEIIHRMTMRHQIVAFSVAVLGAVLAFEAPANTLLAYPILGLFLALGWAHNDFRIGEIGEYIRTQIETKLPGLHWETHFSDLKKNRIPVRYLLRATILSAGGIIMGTQLLALLVPLCQQPASELSPCLIVIDAGAIATTAVVLHWRKLVYLRKGGQA